MLSTNRRPPLSLGLAGLLLSALVVACSPAQTTDNDAGTSTDTHKDAGKKPVEDAGTPPTCVKDPQTYLDFVNSCTDDPPVRPVSHRLPLQLADGGVPALTDTFDPDAGPTDMCVSSKDAGTAAGADAGTNTDTDAGP